MLVWYLQLVIALLGQEKGGVLLPIRLDRVLPVRSMLELVRRLVIGRDARMSDGVSRRGRVIQRGYPGGIWKELNDKVCLRPYSQSRECRSAVPRNAIYCTL